MNIDSVFSYNIGKNLSSIRLVIDDKVKIRVPWGHALMSKQDTQDLLTGAMFRTHPDEIAEAIGRTLPAAQLERLLEARKTVERIRYSEVAIDAK